MLFSIDNANVTVDFTIFPFFRISHRELVGYVAA